MDIEKKQTFLINILFYGVILALAFFGFKYVVPILTPFISAFIIAWLIQRPVKSLARRFNINNKVVGIGLLIFVYLFIGGLIITLAMGLFSYVGDFFAELPSIITNDIRPFLDDIGMNFTEMVASLPSGIQEGFLAALQSLDTALDNLVAAISSWTIDFATGLVTAVPGFFISLVLCIISSFFFVADYERVVGFAISHMNAKVRRFFNDLYRFIKDKVIVVIKSYATIMAITFLELTIAFFIIGLDGFIWIALGIAIFDILPVFGTGGIMIPWALLMFINGNITLGIELSVIYVIVTIIRNIIEPKIVGGNLGLHPVLTLASMLIGSHFFGVVGLFGCPLLISFILYLHKEYGEIKL